MSERIFLYLFVITIPLALGLTTWQSARFESLKREIERNNRTQTELVDQNRRLITEIASLSASSRIGKLARDSLGFDIRRPESVTHLSIRH